MVRGAERPLAQDGTLFVRQTADAPYAGGLHRLLAAHVREDGRQTLGEHGFARTRRSDHEDVVSARGGDFERPLDVFLPLDLGKVGKGKLLLVRRRRRGGDDPLLARKVGEKLGNGMYRVDGEPVGERRLAGVARRDEQLGYACLFGGKRHRQRPAHGAHLAGERQLADHGGVRREGLRLSGGDENAEQDRKIVHGPRLLPVGRREIHGDAADGKVEPAGFHRRSHALACLLYGGVGQTDKVKLRQTAGEKDLRRYLVAADALQAERTNFRNHVSAAFPPKIGVPVDA